MRAEPVFDLAVIGAGILGLATAREAARRGIARRIVVVDKENRPAAHQTGHNSGVIHTGLYYAPGSNKARCCGIGRRLLIDYCREQEIPFRITGKLVVATDESEFAALEALHARGAANGLQELRFVGPEEVREIEPAVRAARAIWVGETGVVDFRAIAARLAADLAARGVEIRLGRRVAAIEQDAGEVRLRTAGGTIRAERVIACAGLHSDRLSRAAGGAIAPTIVPFRGDFYVLRPERADLVRGLVYPVPDPRLPFLGVHATRRIDGSVLLGPNAVLAFGREAYGRADLDLGDLWETITNPSFRRLAARFWRTGLDELVRDYWRPAFVAALRRYFPSLRDEDLLPGPSGVRAQALRADGTLEDDFAYDQIGRFLNVRNAPSPAATSALALAGEFLDRLAAS